MKSIEVTTMYNDASQVKGYRVTVAEAGGLVVIEIPLDTIIVCKPYEDGLIAFLQAED